MKKRIVSVLLVVAILSAMAATAAAAESRNAVCTPTLSFDGTTANCSLTITALGKTIAATMELWQGSTRVAQWSFSGTSRLIVSETKTVTKGKTYTLKVSGTIESEAIPAVQVSGTC